MKDQQSYISFFAVYLKFEVPARSTSPDMTTVFHARLYGRFIEIQRKKL